MTEEQGRKLFYVDTGAIEYDSVTSVLPMRSAGPTTAKSVKRKLLMPQSHKVDPKVASDLEERRQKVLVDYVQKKAELARIKHNAAALNVDLVRNGLADRLLMS